MRPRALAIVLLFSACSRPSAPPSPEAAPASPSPAALPIAPATPTASGSVATAPPDAGAPKPTLPEPGSCANDEDCGAFSASDGKCLNAGDPDPATTGVVCACDTLNRRCVQTWRGDVPCKSWRDCSWQQSSGKPTVSVPAWLTPRPKPSPVRPCKDGEVDSVCEAGTCRIRAWKC